MRIILIGFMGSGKSTIGRRIANFLLIPFIDSDKAIEQIHGKTIPQLFDELGENGFRLIEKQYIESLSNEADYVLATGGGLPCFNQNMDILNGLGTTIYLQRPTRELAHRLLKSKTQRPLIKGMALAELVDFIDKKLAIREETYLKSHFMAKREIDKPKEILEFIGVIQKT